MPFTIVTQGQFTSTGVGVKIPMPSSADYFVSTNRTQMNTTQNPGRVVRAEWYRNAFSQNDGLRWKKTNSTSAINIDQFSTSTASNGVSYYETVPITEAAVTGGTDITAADPAVVTLTNTYSNGDRVRLYATTGMLQIAGMDFTISSVSGSAFTLLGLDASGFAAAATAGTGRRISDFDAVERRCVFITKITQATSAVVTVSTAHSYVVGELVYFSVPNEFGMQEMSGRTGKITAVGTYTMTVDIDSSAFTAFAFPTSANAATSKLFATLAPAGQKTQENYLTGVQTGYDFNYPPFHTGQFSPYIYLAGGAQSPAGSSGDVILWQACKSEIGIIS